MIYQTLTFKNKETKSKEVLDKIFKGAKIWNNLNSFTTFGKKEKLFGTITLSDETTSKEKGGLFYYLNPSKNLVYEGIKCDGFIEYIMEYPKGTHSDITHSLFDLCHLHTGGVDGNWWKLVETKMTNKDLTKKLSYDKLNEEIITLSNSISGNLEDSPKHYEDHFKKIQEIGNHYINSQNNLDKNETAKLQGIISIVYLQLESSMEYTSLKSFRKICDDTKFNEEVSEEAARIKQKRKWRLF